MPKLKPIVQNEHSLCRRCKQFRDCTDAKAVYWRITCDDFTDKSGKGEPLFVELEMA